MLKSDLDELKRTGEDPSQKIYRERMEWAEDDARSVKLKELGNAAFKEGDYKKAFIIYSACIFRTRHEAVYNLNRAAAALSESLVRVLVSRSLTSFEELGLYHRVFEDVKEAIERRVNVAKAHYRSGQANRALGRWADARRDFEAAHALQPGDSSVVSEIAELDRIEALADDERAAWLKAQNPRTVTDYFANPGEFQRLVQEQVDLAKTFTLTMDEIWASHM